jgi:hypothetical protein
MRAIGLLLAAGLAPSGAQAEDAERLRKAMADAPVNTFRYVDSHLVCKQDTPAQNYLACLRIGQLRIGDSFGSVSERYPRPLNVVALEGGISASAFPIVTTTDTYAYWVIGHRDDKIVSIQLTGNYSHPDLAFATIRLNDTEEKVLATLGPRATITVVKEIGALLWDYRPFPISIELVHGRVYSIKVAAPDLTPQ